MKAKFIFLLSVILLILASCNQNGTEYVASSLCKLDGNPYSRTMYSYNEYGQKIEEITETYDKKWSNSSKIEYKYDGEILTEKIECYYDKETKRWLESQSFVYQYKNGVISKQIEMYDGNISGTHVYVYKKGKLSRVNFYSGEERKGYMTGYGIANKKGQVYKELYYEGGEIVSGWEDGVKLIEYDDLGRVVKEIEEWSLGEGHYSTTTYSYDTVGRLTEKKVESGNVVYGEGTVERYTYEYKIKKKEFKMLGGESQQESKQNIDDSQEKENKETKNILVSHDWKRIAAGDYYSECLLEVLHFTKKGKATSTTMYYVGGNKIKSSSFEFTYYVSGGDIYVAVEGADVYSEGEKQFVVRNGTLYSIHGEEYEWGSSLQY